MQGIILTPPNIPPPGTEGKEWATIELPAYEQEWSSRYATGINYNVGYYKRTSDDRDFFIFLRDNAD